MGEIIIKVPINIKETLEINDIHLIKEILSKKEIRKDWDKKFKNKNEEETLVEDFFEDENLDWWEW